MRVNVLGTMVDNISSQESVSQAAQLVGSPGKHYIVTPNPEFVVYARKDQSFQSIINKADLAVPDGVGLIWAGKLLGSPLKARIAGIDLAELLLETASTEGWTVFFLGGRGGSGEAAAERMKGRFPGLKIAGTWEGEADPEGDRRAREVINKHQIDLLLVAYGHPKQEFWIARNLAKIRCKVAIGVGGAFDFWSGKSRRAPVFIRAVGLEWLFRLVLEPWRFKRQLALPVFVWLILRRLTFGR